MTTLREAAQQALEAMRRAVPTGKITLYEWDKALSDLADALAQQAKPGPGKVVAWGVFALADGEWQLQHPVFVGDECGKENAEFERASYSGPQPLEVRPLGVVTALAQQAEPVTIERLRDALVASRIIQPAAVEDPEEYDDGVTLHRIEALHRRIT